MRYPPFAAVSILSLWLALVAGCPGEIDEPTPCDLTYDLLDGLRVDAADHASPVVGGTRFEIRGESFIEETSCVVHQVSLVGGVGGGRNQVVLASEILSPNDISATLPANAVFALGGPGTFTGELEVRFDSAEDSGHFRASLPVAFQLAESLTPAATSLDQVQAYLNDELMVMGDAFLDGGVEGTTWIRLDGTFEADAGGTASVSGVAIPARLVQADDRTRATFQWSPLIGGVAPGTFTGTITPENTHAGGATTSGVALPVDVVQQDTVPSASPTSSRASPSTRSAWARSST